MCPAASEKGSFMGKVVDFEDFLSKKARKHALDEEYDDKQTVIEEMLRPAIDKVARAAGLDPEKFSADSETLNWYLITPFSHPMSDGKTYVPDYRYVTDDTHYLIIFTMEISDPARYKESEFSLQTELWKEDLPSGKCFYFGTDSSWHEMDHGLFHFRDE